MVPIALIQIASVLLCFLVTLVRSQTCPRIQTYHNPRGGDGFAPKNFLRIPKTNVLLINTIKSDSSIVYYNDMSTESGEIINVVKPDFSISEMDYIPNIDMILIINSLKIIIADPYTLSTQASLSISRSQHCVMIENSKYAIITMWYNEINIFDTESVKIVKTLDNSKYANTLYFYQQESRFFTLTYGKSIVMCTNNRGIFTWSLDLDTLESKYNGYIPISLVVNTSTDTYRRFDKHPTADLFFFVGEASSIITVEIVDVEANTYTTWSNVRMYGGDYDTRLVSVKYLEIVKNGITYQRLYVGDASFVYYLPLTFNWTGKYMTYEDYTNPGYIYMEYTYRWYYLKELQTFAMAASYCVTMLNLVSEWGIFNLYFYSDGVQRRFMYEELSVDLYLLHVYNNIFVFQWENLGVKYKFQKNLLAKNYRSFPNSEFRVKLCPNCMLYKTGQDGYDQYISTMLVYPFNSPENAIKVQDLGFTWLTLTLNIDPFFLDNTVWFVTGPLVKNSTNSDFLFILINAYTGAMTNLAVSDTATNANKPSFAVVSLLDASNREIIGFDVAGNVHVWDLTTRVFKFSKTIDSTCTNSDIGDVFENGSRKWLVVVCEDLRVLLYDFDSYTATQLLKLTSNPYALRAFNVPGIVVIGDYNSGEAFIYKFIESSQTFEYFIMLQTGKFKDKLINIELLSDYRIWLQYTYSNYFFSLQDCFDDYETCLKCQQPNYFSITNAYDSYGAYGRGTAADPYTSSYSFFTSMIKAQYYKELVNGVSNMGVSIIIDPSHVMSLLSAFMNFDFSSIISLTFQSNQDDVLASIHYEDSLVFTNYNYVMLQDIIVYFELSMTTAKCGLSFLTTSETAILKNVSVVLLSASATNCNSILAESTYLQVINYSIDDQDFTTHGTIITVDDASQVSLSQFSVTNSIFGDTLSILESPLTTSATMTQITLTGNSCSSTSDPDSVAVSLFSAGLFQVDALSITDNAFCKKTLFTTMSSISQLHQQFSFNNITVTSNSFQARTVYLFFNSLYSMRPAPLHVLVFTNATFTSNSLVVDDENDLDTAMMLNTNKIKNLTFSNITLTDMPLVSFGLFEYSTYVTLDAFSCSDPQSYADTNPASSYSAGCMIFNEAQSCILSNMTISKKRSQDVSLVEIENQKYKDGVLKILSSNFTELMLYQTQINTYAIPLKINSNYKATITIDNCTFTDNELDNLQYSLTFSSTALWIQNFLGAVSISQSKFLRSQSNSKYNFVYTKSSGFNISECEFSESSISDSSVAFKQEGGFIRVQVQDLTIQASSFAKSSALIGGFLYIESFSQLISIAVTDTSFNEGYANEDGGAIFIDQGTSLLSMTCNNCTFNNIYTFSSSASAFAFQKYASIKQTSMHSISFKNGSIRNIHGIGDNFFTRIENTNISLANISQISSYAFSSSSYAHQLYVDTALKQQSTFIYATVSAISMVSCHMFDLFPQTTASSYPMIIYASNTPVNLTQSSFNSSDFKNTAIEVINSNLTISGSTFKNISQIPLTSRRSLASGTTSTTTTTTMSSLILLSSSILSSSALTTFDDIVCSSNCNGSVFQLLKSSFNMSDTTISNSQASTGGAMYINGISGINQITGSNFLDNTANLSGGAVYLNALSTDDFSLLISNSIFTANKALNGKGGGLFFSTESLNPSDQSIEIIGSLINLNEAQVGGAISENDISAKIASNSVLQNNVAYYYGSGLVSYPSHLSVKNVGQFLEKTANSTADATTGDLTLSTYRSGATLSSLVFGMVDDSKEEMYPITDDEEATYSITVSIDPSTPKFSSYQIRGDTTVYYTANQGYVFTGLVLVGIPGTSATILFKSNQIYVLDTTTNTYESTYSFKMKVDFRECIGGEEVTNYSGYTECTECASGQFSFDVKSCYDCPIGAECLGGSSIVTTYGYWRKTESSSDVIECSNLEANCSGGSHGDKICYEGHIGALCEECDIFGEYWNESFAKSGKYTCVKCNEIKNNIWIVALMTIWTLISMSLAIKGDIEALEHKAAIEMIQKHILFRKQQQRQSSSIVKSPTLARGSTITNRLTASTPLTPEVRTVPIVPIVAEDKSGIYIKMLTNYLQIVGSIATFNLSIPSGIIEFPESIGQPIQQTMNSLDCVLKDMDTSIPIIYLRLIFSLIIPFVYMLIFVIGLTLLHLTRKNKKQYPYYILSTALMFLVIYLQPDLVAQMIALLSCRTVGDTDYVLSNVSFECHTTATDTYSLAFVSPMLAIWVLILPLFLFSMLRRHKESLNTTRIKLKYGFLYKEYTTNAFYWEFVKMAVKIAIILSLNFYSQSIITKGILVFIVITMYGILSIVIKPYREMDINEIDVHSTNVCAVTVLLGLFIYKNPFNYFIYTSFGLIIAINLIFFISIVKMIVFEYLKVIEEALQGILKQLAKKIPFLLRFQKKEAPKKKMNEIIKRKMRLLMLKFIKLDPNRKKEIVMQMYEQQLEQKHSKFFVETPKARRKEPSSSTTSKNNSPTLGPNQKGDPEIISMDSPSLEFETEPDNVFVASNVKQFPQIDNPATKNPQKSQIDSGLSLLQFSLSSPTGLYPLNSNKLDSIKEEQVQLQFKDTNQYGK